MLIQFTTEEDRGLFEECCSKIQTHSHDVLPDVRPFCEHFWGDHSAIFAATTMTVAKQARKIYGFIDPSSFVGGNGKC